MRIRDGIDGSDLGAMAINDVILGNATGIAFGPAGADGKRSLYVGQGNAGGVVNRFDADTGAFLNVAANLFLVLGAGQRPTDIEVGADGILYVAEQTGTGTITRWDGTTGTFIDAPGVPFIVPGGADVHDIEFGPSNTLYTQVYSPKEIRWFDLGAAPGSGPVGSFSTAGNPYQGLSLTEDYGFVAFPEPASLALLGLGGLMMIRRKR